jgi:hypothetical protein
VYNLTFASKVTGELCPCFTARRLENLIVELARCLHEIGYMVPDWPLIVQALEVGGEYFEENESCWLLIEKTI